MRATIAFLLVLLVAGIMAMDDPGTPLRTLGSSVKPAPQAPAARLAPGPAIAQAPGTTAPFPERAPVTSGQDGRIDSEKLAATLPKVGGSKLPATLELVTFGPSVGPLAPVQHTTITRTEAVAAAMGSQAFQETVTPLARLYFAALGRFPDYEGLNYYTGQREDARPLDAIANEFAGSKEFEARYGALDNAEFVARILSNVLGHRSQADVREHWTAELDSGRMTRGQVIVDFSESGAFQERVANEVFVATAYTEVLQRTPDPKAFTYWVAQRAGGQPASAVIEGLLATK